MKIIRYFVSARPSSGWAVVPVNLDSYGREVLGSNVLVVRTKEMAQAIADNRNVGLERLQCPVCCVGDGSHEPKCTNKTWTPESTPGSKKRVDITSVRRR